MEQWEVKMIFTDPRSDEVLQAVVTCPWDEVENEMGILLYSLPREHRFERFCIKINEK